MQSIEPIRIRGTRYRRLVAGAFVVVLGTAALACGSKNAASPTDAASTATAITTTEPVATAAPTATAIPIWEHETTVEKCEGMGGVVTTDPGDGSTRRTEFRCPSGSPPIGRMPLGREGAVCCT